MRGIFFVNTPQKIPYTRVCGIFYFFTFHSSLFSKSPPRDFSGEEIREKREKKMYLFAMAKSNFN